MADWVGFAGAAVVGALALLLPGAAVGGALRLRGLTLVAVAAPLTILLVGVSGVLGGYLSWRFGWWLVALLAAVIAAAILLVGRLRGARRPAPVDAWNRALLPVLPAIVGSAILIGVLAASAVGAPDRVSQTYDAVFHLNAAASILQNGNASSFDLYRLTHPGVGFEFYPSAWHSLVVITAQLTGVSVPVATTATWVAMAGAAWVPGVVLLSRTLLPGSGPTWLNGVTSALLAASFAGFPYLLLEWGTLYPTGLAYSILPTGLALAVLFVRPQSGTGTETMQQPDPSWPGTARPVLFGGLLVAWILASSFAHPRALASFAVLATPLAVVWGLQWSRRRRRQPGGARQVAVVWAAVGLTVLAVLTAGIVYVFRTYDVVNRPIAAHLNGGPAVATQSLGESALQAIGLTSPDVPTVALLASPVLALLVLSGLLLVLVRPGRRWIAVTYLAVVVLYCLAAGSNSDLAKVATGLWYKDKFRLFAVLPVLAVPFATLAVLRISAALGRAALAGRLGMLPPAARTAGITLLLLGVVGVSSVLSPALGGMRQVISAAYALPAGAKNGYLVNADELSVLRTLDRYVPAGQRVAGNPWNGSALAWPVGGRESLFPHLTGQWDPARNLIASSLDRAGQDPAVCAALRELNVQYFLASDGLLWGGNPQADFFGGIDRAAAAGIGTVVASQGGTRLIKITAC